MQADPNDDPPVWQRALGVRREEARLLGWAGAFHFALLLAYYLQRPLRETFGIRGDIEDLPWVWSGTTVAMLVAAPLLALLVSRLPRRKFVPLVYVLGAACVAAFWLALRIVPARPGASGDPHVALGYAFYVWLSVFNLVAVAMFWGTLADVFSREQGARLFGLVGAVGTLGAIAGSSVPAWLLGEHELLGARWTLDPHDLLALAVPVLLATAFCARGVARAAGLGGTTRTVNAVWKPGPEPSREVWEGLRRIARSPYLQLICAYMLLYTLTGAFLYFAQARIGKASFQDESARTSFFGWIDFATNVVTLIVQVFATGRLLTRAGVGVGLAALPLVTLASFGALTLWAVPAAVIVAQAARRCVHYAVDRPSREVLYTVLGPEETYKSKGLIDTLVYRGGDLLGAFVDKWLAGIGAVLAVVAGAACAVWLGIGVVLARRHERLHERQGSDSRR